MVSLPVNVLIISFAVVREYTDVFVTYSGAPEKVWVAEITGVIVLGPPLASTEIHTLFGLP